MIVVYTTIFGGSDSLKPAPKGADRCVCFVGDPAEQADENGWELVVPGPLFVSNAMFREPRRSAWYMRCIAHRLFQEATRTIWIDASLTLTDLPRLLKDAGDAPIAALQHHRRQTAYQEAAELVKNGQADRADIAAQVNAYRAAGYAGIPLSISCLIVRDNSPDVQRFNETWDAQIRQYEGDNTQVSLDYSAWKNGLAIKALRGTRHENPYSTHDHDDHKRRRKPYRVAA